MLLDFAPLTSDRLASYFEVFCIDDDSRFWGWAFHGYAWMPTLIKILVTISYSLFVEKKAVYKKICIQHDGKMKSE